MMSVKKPNNTVSLTVNIIANLKVHITALRSEFQLAHPVYAMNWFNTNWLWLYNFYNLLAARSVLKIDGLPFFKARVERTLHGNIEDRRTMLLIVRYPSIENFKRMLESRYFQFVSLFRDIAVKEFTFSFSTRLDVQDTQNSLPITKIDNYGVYAVHHFRIHDDLNSAALTKQVRELAKEARVDLVFSSEISARLYTQQGEKEALPVDTVMENCLILQAQTDADIELLINSDAYQALIAKTQGSFIATLNRVF